MLVIQIALLVAILITIVGVCFDIYSKVKEIKEQKTKKAPLRARAFLVEIKCNSRKCLMTTLL